MEFTGDTAPFTGFLELAVGANAGDADVPEANGRIVIRGSKLTAMSISLTASFDWPNGSVIIKDSTLIATGEGSLPGDISVRASDLSGRRGEVTVLRSDLIAARSIHVGTGIPTFLDPGGGSYGLTKVVDSHVQAGGPITIHGSSDGRVSVTGTTLQSTSTVEIMTGIGGTCISSGNTPPVPCT
jgi:hypothetical protein